MPTVSYMNHILHIRQSRKNQWKQLPDAEYIDIPFDTPPQLKQGDSCFNHRCIPNKLPCWLVLHSVRKLDYTVPVCPTVQFYIFMPTAFAVLCSKYLHWHLYPYRVLYDTLDTPTRGLQDFLPVDFYTHNRNTSDCLDTL